jgi:RNA polymerase sigma-19 factor, ECF subfamily
MENQAVPEPKLSAELFDELYKPLCFYANMFAHDWEFSEEVAAEMIHEFHQKKCDLRSEEVRKQLYTAVKRRCFNEKKRKRTFRRIEKKWAEENLAEEDLPILKMETELVQKIYAELIEKLPERKRVAFKGRLEDIPAKEMARLMDIELSTYYNLKNQGVEQLTKMAGDAGLSLWFIALLTLFFNENWKN